MNDIDESPFDLTSTIMTEETFEALRNKTISDLKYMKIINEIMYNITKDQKYNKDFQSIIDIMEMNPCE